MLSTRRFSTTKSSRTHPSTVPSSSSAPSALQPKILQPKGKILHVSSSAATASRPRPRTSRSFPAESTMVSAPFAALAALFVAFSALFLFLDPHSAPSTSTSSPASTLDSAVAFTVNELLPFQVLLPLAATVVLFAAVAFVHLHHAAHRAGNQRLSELVAFVLCGAAGTLDFVFFVWKPAAAVTAVADDVGALVLALGVAAADALPFTATVTFFLGITLVIAHIRAGGEGGGGDGAVADHRRVPMPVDLLKKLALGAAAALLVQMAMALCVK